MAHLTLQIMRALFVLRDPIWARLAGFSFYENSRRLFFCEIFFEMAMLP
jgi:hypothetical protein